MNVKHCLEVITIRSIYLANALGFSSTGVTSLNEIQNRLENARCKVYEPFSSCKELGMEISKLERVPGNIVAARETMHDLSMRIGKLNRDAIAGADLIVAILDGSGLDVDSGVAAEIGYAAAIGKKIFGLRTDFRRSGENPGVQVNLQVEYFITSSGGRIFNQLDDLVNVILV